MLLFMEFYQLHFIEFAFHRWGGCPFLLVESLPPWVSHEDLGELKWDQKWRCGLWSAALVSVLLLVVQQAPLRIGFESDRLDFFLACGSVFAEGLVGLFVYGDLVVLAKWRLQVVRQGGRRQPVYTDLQEMELEQRSASAPPRRRLQDQKSD